MLDDLYIGLGANLPHLRFGSPRATLEHALSLFPSVGLKVTQRSRWYESAPVPVSDQPWFVNAVVRCSTTKSPQEALTALHRFETEFGRRRMVRDEARSIDLDIIAIGNMILPGPTPPIVPHPRMAERAFVLIPLAELAPDWGHPVTGEAISTLINRLPPEQKTRPMQDQAGSHAGPAA
jgi:2-amino-4-hydroxy-6-hydroxymethyldihydropteridine diphosphokinase